MLSRSTSPQLRTLSEATAPGDSLLPEHEALFPRYVGIQRNHYPVSFFNRKTVNQISDEVTRLLHGVHPEGKNIIVPDETILSVMDSINQNNPRTSSDRYAQMTVAYITNYISNEFGVVSQNNKLNIDIIKYDDTYGIRQYPQIKLNRKRPTPLIFNYNY